MSKKYTSKKFLKKKKNLLKLKIILGVFFAVMLIAGFFYLMNQDFLRVSGIKISDTNFVNTQELEKIVNNILSENKFMYIPNDNFIFIPKRKIENIIKEEFLEISDIKFHLNDFDTLTLKILEYEPKAIYSSEEVNYFINTRGEIFMEEPIIHSYNELIKIFYDEKNVKLGKKVVDSDFINKIDNFVNNIEGLGIKVDLIKNQSEDVYYLEIKDGYYLIISSLDSTENYYLNLKTIFDQGILSTENINNLEYIDLRFGNKIFYKFQETE